MLIAEKTRDPIEKEVVKDTIEKVMKVKLEPGTLYDSYAIPRNEFSPEISCPKLSWTKGMRRLHALISNALDHHEPVLLVGDTGSGKTSICQFIAAARSQKLIMLNAHQNLESSDLVGAQRPLRDREQLLQQQYQDLKSLLSNDPNVSAGANHKQLLAYYLSHESNLRLKARDVLDQIDCCDRINDSVKRQQRLFEWVDGPLVKAMKMNDIFLFDEISLADDAVLERLNSVLEDERTMVLAENFGDLSVISAGDSFQFLATMNPGGDYGKKELSPALRNRFTEIWVPSVSEHDEIKDIVSSALSPDVQKFSEIIVSFSIWFSERYSSRIQILSLSVRDILSWVTFVNDASIMSSDIFRLVEGARMMLIDCLSFLPEAQSLSLNIHSEQYICQKKLSALLKVTEDELDNGDISVTLADSYLNVGAFRIARNTSESPPTFVVDTPTTKRNIYKIIRAMTLSKPLLLEGSPGIGKTATVIALANLVGQSLIRINLSDQTDVSDLFGSDLPVVDGTIGAFAWRSAPFLHALEMGHWVLLDELNLASQSVLESLNACFDHRGSAFIPELGRSFYLHPNFRVFAAQNPLVQGGGRKGLPKSFLNRFSLIYMEPLDTHDMLKIASCSFPTISNNTAYIENLIAYLFELQWFYGPSSDRGRASGGPWEFNLRDLFRWLRSLSDEEVLAQVYGPETYLEPLILGRFRTSEDLDHARSLFQKQFELKHPLKLFSLQSTFSLIGGTLKQRDTFYQLEEVSTDIISPVFSKMEPLNLAIKMSWPALLVGSSCTGKSTAIKYLASFYGAALQTFFVNPETDVMDLIGNFQQQDHFNLMIRNFEHCSLILRLRGAELLCNSDIGGFKKIAVLLQLFETKGTDGSYQDNLQKKIYDLLHIWSSNAENFANVCTSTIYDTISDMIQLCLNQASSATFKWFDGPLIEAARLGHWIVLENANLCTSSVLDRLNALLESGETLLVHENPQTDGSPSHINVHRNFRIFLTMDPAYGELSRAMRNRCVEVYFDRQMSFVEGRKARSNHFLMQLDPSALITSPIHAKRTKDIKLSQHLTIFETAMKVELIDAENTDYIVFLCDVLHIPLLQSFICLLESRYIQTSISLQIVPAALNSFKIRENLATTMTDMINWQAKFSSPPQSQAQIADVSMVFVMNNVLTCCRHIEKCNAY